MACFYLRTWAVSLCGEMVNHQGMKRCSYLVFKLSMFCSQYVVVWFLRLVNILCIIGINDKKVFHWDI
uniref:Uncharacterized protein n=1 Tax=Siphoviridae sp. ctDsE1 TaxID=2825390 RepID=A0A8S5TYL0_9CAUD|nr:MAG TPA: hypothetical protein [Siphoviridae sp. ctDsE1]